ncbi:MAG: hypothetical protein WCK98_08085 [bacterium]
MNDNFHYYRDINIQKNFEIKLEDIIERDLTETEKTKIINYSYYLGICADDETRQKAIEKMRFCILKKGNGLKFLIDAISNSEKANKIILPGNYQYDLDDNGIFDLNKIYPCVDSSEYFEMLRSIALGVYPSWVTCEKQEQELIQLLTESNSRISHTDKQLSDLQMSRIFSGYSQNIEAGFPADVGIKAINGYELFFRDIFDSQTNQLSAPRKGYLRPQVHGSDGIRLYRNESNYIGVIDEIERVCNEILDKTGSLVITPSKVKELIVIGYKS